MTAPAAAPLVTLNNGTQMPTVALGTWKSAPGDVRLAVAAALRSGYRHIDTADVYGNEAEVGQGINDVLSTGELKREDIYVTTKLWNTNHHPDHVKPALQLQLQRLGLSYVDLYLIHWPVCFEHTNFGECWARRPDNSLPWTFEHSYQSTWRAMEQLVDEGLTKSIGVSNVQGELLYDVLTYARIKPVANQVELHPYVQQTRLVQLCQSQNIVVMAYSPLGSPEFSKNCGTVLLEDPVLNQLAQKYNKTPAHVALRWSCQRGLIPLPKSVTPARIAQNINIFDFTLTAEEMKAIEGVNRNHRFVNPQWSIPFFE